MDLFGQWRRALELFKLPSEPEVLLAAPEAEPSVMEALLELRPAAHVVALELWPERKSEQQDLLGRRPFFLSNAERALDPQSLDLILFDHTLDDFILRLIAQHEGIVIDDEAQGEYSPVPRALRAYWRAGDLEAVVAPELVALLGAFGRALRKEGLLLLHHWVVGTDLLIGQPFDLYSDYIPIVRKWVKAANKSLHEKEINGLDSHWWLALSITS